jgi:hypothetical protein
MPSIPIGHNPPTAHLNIQKGCENNSKPIFPTLNAKTGRKS